MGWYNRLLKWMGRMITWGAAIFVVLLLFSLTWNPFLSVYWFVLGIILLGCLLFYGILLFFNGILEIQNLDYQASASAKRRNGVLFAYGSLIALFLIYIPEYHRFSTSGIVIVWIFCFSALTVILWIASRTVRNKEGYKPSRIFGILGYILSVLIILFALLRLFGFLISKF